MSELTSLQKNFPAVCALKMNEPMSRHTSFRIGGPAEIMAFPKNENELSAILQAAAKRGVKPAVLGAGTNVQEKADPDHCVCCFGAADGTSGGRSDLGKQCPESDG